VILEHSVLGLHTCLVPVFPSLVLCITCLVPALYPLLSCIPCLGSAPQYILCAYSVHSFQVCITSTSILASLRCTCFIIAWQILSTPCRHSGQTPHRPSRTLRPTDRNTGPVDQEAVKAEQERVREILARFPPKDRFNLNETALLPFAVPDHGLATVHISGKKVNKFCITLALLCNADGSQKFLIFYISRARHPVCNTSLSVRPTWTMKCGCNHE
jgi:hypothetical protein